MSKGKWVGDHLIRRLTEFGVRHIFGVPGDCALGIYDLLGESESIRFIATRDEQGAGLAADAYARIKGLGAVCVSGGAGALTLARSTALAYAERSPVVIISGAPGIQEQKIGFLQHQAAEVAAKKRIFAEFTVAATRIDSSDTARAEIDRVLSAALRYKRPVYIELPRDQVLAFCPPQRTTPLAQEKSDPANLQEALKEAVKLINAAERPVILAGVEIPRFGLQKELCRLARKNGIPVAATILAKSVIADTEKFSMGVYEGACGLEEVQTFVESSDCLLLLGTFLPNLHLDRCPVEIDPDASIYATIDRITIKGRSFVDILFQDFIKGLLKASIRPRKLGDIPHPPKPKASAKGQQDAKINVDNLLRQIDLFIDEKTLVVADSGDALFGASDLFMRRSNQFLSPTFSASPGFAVPGTLGAQLADPAVRPLILVGDGAFQMTGMEISTIARYGLNPIVIVFNNEGYATGRLMLDGPLNDIHPWRFSKIPSVIGAGIGFIVETTNELAQALRTAKKNIESFTIIDVKLNRRDRSASLARLIHKLEEK